MDRGPRVPDNVRLQIANTYLELRKKNPKIKAPAVREVVRGTLKKVPYPGWPGLSVIQKVITEIHKKDTDLLFRRQDEPWCLSTKVEFPIPPNALKIVCDIWEHKLNQSIAIAAKYASDEVERIEFNKILSIRGVTCLSIREVKWIALLYAILKKDETEDKEGSYPTRLYETAELYAQAERLHEILGIPFESDKMDRHLILGIPKLLKVTAHSITVLRLSSAKEHLSNFDPLARINNVSGSIDPLLIDGKVPEWLIPLVAFGGPEEAQEIMRKQGVKIPTKAKLTRKGAKK
ncbi:MAG: hypothetical protein WC566_05685 [Dehalococcoidia bacterium]